MQKRLHEATCKHCGEDIYYSDFTGCWLHLRSAAPECRSCVAEPAGETEKP